MWVYIFAKTRLDSTNFIWYIQKQIMLYMWASWTMAQSFAALDTHTHKIALE